jgi:putative peptidoglycan lipid II flippase
MLISLASIAVNYGVAVSMIHLAGLGHAGLALSTSAVALFGFLVQFAILRTRIGGVYGRDLVAGLIKVCAASLVMGIAVVLSSKIAESFAGVNQFGRLADLAISIPLGLAVFYAMCRALKLSEIDLLVRSFAAPVARKLRGRKR